MPPGADQLALPCGPSCQPLKSDSFRANTSAKKRCARVANAPSTRQAALCHVANLRSEAMVRELMCVYADEAPVPREKSSPSVGTRRVRNLRAWAEQISQLSLRSPYEHRVPCAMLPAIRTHHFEVDLSTGQNNKPPNLAVTPALLLACKGRRPHIAPAVSLVWGDPTLLEFASRRLARIEYGTWVLRANRVAWVELHTVLIMPLVRKTFFHHRLRVDVSRLDLGGRERRLRDWR